MVDLSLLKYLRETKGIDEDLYDCLRYSLEDHIYYFGAHFKYPHEKEGATSLAQWWKQLLKEGYVRYKYARSRPADDRKNIVSNAYFNFNEKLAKLGYNVMMPTWSVRKSEAGIFGDIQFYRLTNRMMQTLKDSDFHYLVSKSFQEEVRRFKEMMTERYQADNVSALFVPNDVVFFENISISSFKQLKRPSFTFLHGLPGRYNIIDENRSDYLIVWGEKIRQYYIKQGFSPNKILVSGHPFYSDAVKKELRSDLTDILVLAKIGPGAHHSDGVKLYDRGNMIIYLLAVQRSLSKLGVKQVRLRLHPSASGEWIYKFIDKDFFVPDTLPLAGSLQKASLVVGPTSTVFLEALYAGVNYMVFEPAEQNISVLNEPLVPPFDGSEPGVPVAKNEAELEYNVRNNVKIDNNILKEFISTPFDIGFLKEMI